MLRQVLKKMTTKKANRVDDDSSSVQTEATAPLTPTVSPIVSQETRKRYKGGRKTSVGNNTKAHNRKYSSLWNGPTLHPIELPSALFQQASNEKHRLNTRIDILDEAIATLEAFRSKDHRRAYKKSVSFADSVSNFSDDSFSSCEDRNAWSSSELSILDTAPNMPLR